MAEWNVVRFDPSWEEKLDPEIIPLCDELNAAGFVTTSSCSGHGGQAWPHVWFEHSSDERIERLARFVMAAEVGDYRAFFTVWQKDILLDGYQWSVEVHLNNVYGSTTKEVRGAETVSALAQVTQRVIEFAACEE